VKQLVHSLLDHPWVFEVQQRICNNYSAVRDHFQEHLCTRNKDILDIGCSTGACASVCVSMKDNQYKGIDIESRYIETARSRCPDGEFHVMDARQLAFPDQSFDVVLFVGALHHMHDDIVRDCFQEIRRVLRPGGVVLCAEPMFTKSWLSTLLLRNDRGKHIRAPHGYQSLFSQFQVARQGQFRLAVHQFCSFVLKADLQKASQEDPEFGRKAARAAA
jgi:ubiquinone/menaquinone biosynthesis C-methylase UbiE